MTNTPLGSVTFKRFSFTHDVELFHDWVTQPYAHFWGMQSHSTTQITAEYAKLIDQQGTACFIGLIAQQPVCFLETYQPASSPLAKHIDIHEGDCGMHILLAPNKTPISGFSSHIFASCLDFLFNEKQITRLLVEPDIRNTNIHKLNRRFGFKHTQQIQLENKTAYLGICEKQDFSFAYKQWMNTATKQAVDIQDREGFERVNLHLIKKSLTEFIHERLIIPTKCAARLFEVVAEPSGNRYQFTADILLLEHYLIDAPSIRCLDDNGQHRTLCISHFILDFADALGLQQLALANYLEEVNSTLYSLLFKYQNPTAIDALLDADFQTLEQIMIEGHPIFIANSGRIGFDQSDFHHYSPEAATPLSLVWLAADKNDCHFSHSEGINYQQLIEEELDASERDQFIALLRNQNLNPCGYVFLPVHPWQWKNKLQQLFTQDIANQKLVYLGESQDRYQPQQSIRTFFNQSSFGKRYVKVALSITNMGFVRGLSADYMRVTPAINDYIDQLLKDDAILKELPFEILKEEAAMGYRQRTYDLPVLKDAPFKKMLACLWRENPLTKISGEQRLMTMAGLLHVDFEGEALVKILINASGLSTEAWLQAYFSVYLTPLLHCFYRHKLVFMPHGENLILAFDQHVPVKAFMKDIAEEICLLNVSPDALPDDVKRIAITLDKDMELGK